MLKIISIKDCLQNFEKSCCNIKNIFAWKNIFVKKDIFVTEIYYYKKNKTVIDINCVFKIKVIEIVFFNCLYLLITTIATKTVAIIFSN